jgi:RND superfamily putative drug exporter
MHTFGRANWYLPPWLERRLPHLDLDEATTTTAEPDRQPVLVGSEP